MILGSKKTLAESLNSVKTEPPNAPSRNKFLAVVIKNYTKVIFKLLQSCPFFLDFFRYLNILSTIADVYHTWREIFTMLLSSKISYLRKDIKTVIFKNLMQKTINSTLRNN